MSLDTLNTLVIALAGMVGAGVLTLGVASLVLCDRPTEQESSQWNPNTSSTDTGTQPIVSSM